MKLIQLERKPAGKTPSVSDTFQKFREVQIKFQSLEFESEELSMSKRQRERVRKALSKMWTQVKAQENALLKANNEGQNHSGAFVEMQERSELLLQRFEMRVSEARSLTQVTLVPAAPEEQEEIEEPLRATA